MLRATIDYLLDIIPFCLRHKIFCLSYVRQLFVPVARSKKPNCRINYIQLSQVYPAKITSQRGWLANGGYSFQPRGGYFTWRSPEIECFHEAFSWPCTKLGRPDVTACYVTNPCNPDYLSCHSAWGGFYERAALTFSDAGALVAVCLVSKRRKTHEWRKEKRQRDTLADRFSSSDYRAMHRANARTRSVLSRG